MTEAECPCGGTGWRPVSEKYAAGNADQLHDREADPNRWASAFAALLNSVYPCKTHNADAFWRWANGHMKPEHDRSACPDCQPVKASGRSMRRGSSSGPRHAGGDEPPPPTDDDHARSDQ